MDENKLKILKMLEEGKINAEEAYKLLNATDEDNLKGKRLVVKLKSPSENVNFSIPLGAVKGMIKLTGKFVNLIPDSAKAKLGEKGMDSERLAELINSIGDVFSGAPQVLIQGKEGEAEFYIGIE